MTRELAGAPAGVGAWITRRLVTSRSVAGVSVRSTSGRTKAAGLAESCCRQLDSQRLGQLDRLCSSVALRSLHQPESGNRHKESERFAPKCEVDPLSWTHHSEGAQTKEPAVGRPSIYLEEFRREACELAGRGDRSIRQVAAGLGRCNWLKA
jgi:hypothetical protein